jgi:hypothetical protein
MMINESSRLEPWNAPKEESKATSEKNEQIFSSQAFACSAYLMVSQYGC